MGKFKSAFKRFLGFEAEVPTTLLDEELASEQARSNFDVQEPLQDTLEMNEKPSKVYEGKRRDEITMYPENFSDACEVVEQIASGKIVTINMEALDLDTCKRISDFVLGAVYVLQGDVEKVGSRSFRFWVD